MISRTYLFTDKVSACIFWGIFIILAIYKLWRFIGKNFHTGLKK